MLRNNGKPLTSQNLTLEDEMPNCGPRLDKLIHQFLGVVTLALDLRLTHIIAHSKDISENYNFGKSNISPWMHVAPIFPKKNRLGPQNGFGSSGPKKLLKIVNCATIMEIENLKETVVGVQVG